MRIVVGVLLGASPLLSLSCAPRERPPVEQVRRGAFRREVEAEGVLQAVTSTPVTVPPSAMGALQVAWIVEDGTFVREGDLLVRFDASEIEKELVAAELALGTSERRLEQREIQKEASLSNAERDRKLAELELGMARRFSDKDPEIFSRVEIIESRIDERLSAEKVDNAEAREESERKLAASEQELLRIERGVAEAKAARARAALGALELRAPHDGIVVLTKDWMGNTLQLGNTTYSGHPVAELPALGRMEASVHVLEADAGGLKEGSPATVVVEGRPGMTLPATIRKVDRMPKPRLRGLPLQFFEAILTLGEPEGPEEIDPALLKPGQRVRARLVLEELDDVLTVPRQAVREDGDERYVYRREGGEFRKVAVTLGPASLGRIVIESGLEEGDVIASRDPGRSRKELVPVTPGAAGGDGET